MSGTKKLRPADRHITRAECQALIVHTLNQIFADVQAPSRADQIVRDVERGGLELAAALSQGAEDAGIWSAPSLETFPTHSEGAE